MILGSSRISQHLREYNNSQFGISSFYNKHCCFCRREEISSSSSSSCSFINPHRLPPPFAVSSSKRFFGLDTNSSCSSSRVTNCNEDRAFLSSGKSIRCAPRVSGCLSVAEDGQGPASERLSLVAGGIVALGKFDALHIGHRELAIQAAKIGVPFILSFIGMAEILGWEPRPPVVAKCDRTRVLSSWAPLCSNVIPKEFQVEFSKVRYRTPQQFVEKLSRELGVRGVVAGQNYRFGYKAVGDASELLRLCEEYGMEAYIINSVMDKNQHSQDISTKNNNLKEQGQVCSTRVRHALAHGDMKYVSELLGRHHRLILDVKNNGMVFCNRKMLSANRSCLLNLSPKDGRYENCSVLMDGENVIPCTVVIDTREINLELYQLDPRIELAAESCELLSIDFVDSIL